MKIGSLSILILLLYTSAGIAQSGSGPDTKRSVIYSDTTIEGWHVKINNELFQTHRLVTHDATDSLSVELKKIAALLPANAVSYLKEVPIWFEFTNSRHLPNWYHFAGSSPWGRYPDKERGGTIEILVPEYLTMDHFSLPLLADMAYAYHENVIGLANRDIIDQFEHARSIGAYVVTAGKKKEFVYRNFTEYFANISLAYFGSSTMPPHNREELKKIDPGAYDLVEKLWKVK